MFHVKHYLLCYVRKERIRMKKGGLGKGLDSLISKGSDLNVSRETLLRVSEIEPNRNQPRKIFEEGAIEELANSIIENGLIQPIVVVKKEDYYQIVAGERRWRASKKAGLKKLPVIIKEYTDRQIDEISLIENIQRENLNVIEEANGINSLINEYSLKQEELAKIISKSRAYIANSIRLLRLPDKIQGLLLEKKLSGGHARAILSLEDENQQIEVAEYTIEKKFSVRELEAYIKSLKKPKKVKEDKKIEIIALEHKLESSLGTKVRVSNNAKNRGKIEISYSSLEELERLIDKIR